MRQEIDFHSQKLHVSAVQPVLDAEPAVARVELEVMEVMELRGEGEREVVSGVVIHHLKQGLYRISKLSQYSNLYS